MALLEVTDLDVGYATKEGFARVVRDASFSLERREVLGVVGESGSGKTTLAHVVMGYKAPGLSVTAGRVAFDGISLLDASSYALRRLWGRRIAMVHQNPLATLTPSMTVGAQIAEVIGTHRSIGRKEALERTVLSLESVNLPSPAYFIDRYPHQLSAGQRQRVSIALALSLEPDLLLLDEPTTNLDATTEAVILDLLEEIKARVESSMIYISHNFGVIARVATRVAVMYAGELVETGTTGEIFRSPAHPYTRALLACLPSRRITKRRGRLYSIGGELPSLVDVGEACVFSPRCPSSTAECARSPGWTTLGEGHAVRCWNHARTPADLARVESAASAVRPGTEVVLRVDALSKGYPNMVRTALRRREVRAVTEASMRVPRGAVVGLVGESGSGKTTFLRCIAGLERADDGRMVHLGIDLPAALASRPREVLKAIQMVFQDPESTLNPSLTAAENLRRHLACLRPVESATAAALVDRALAQVRLDAGHGRRLPGELSGGEKQRVAIARAFLSEPGLVLCDEPFSALDVSVQSAVCQLLLDLQAKGRNSYVFVSHDLSIVRYMSDYIVVMYLGEIVEEGEVDSFDRRPVHPYTEALFSATAVPDPTVRQDRVRLGGQASEADKYRGGCIFSARCPRKIGAVCEEQAPAWQTVDGRRYRCHISAPELERLQDAGSAAAAYGEA